MIHSKRIHLDSQTAALLNKLDPDKMNKLEGNSALSASVITALFRGIFVDLTGRRHVYYVLTLQRCHAINNKSLNIAVVTIFFFMKVVEWGKKL